MGSGRAGQATAGLGNRERKAVGWVGSFHARIGTPLPIPADTAASSAAAGAGAVLQRTARQQRGYKGSAATRHAGHTSVLSAEGPGGVTLKGGGGRKREGVTSRSRRGEEGRGEARSTRRVGAAARGSGCATAAPPRSYSPLLRSGLLPPRVLDQPLKGDVDVDRVFSRD